MFNYIIRRLLLIIPTLFIILTVNFFLIQNAPGGPVEQAIAKLERGSIDSPSLLLGQSNAISLSASNPYKGARGLDESFIEEINKQYGFDKPILERYFTTLKNFLVFDFGDSFFKSDSVLNLIIKSLPVSISLGLWSTLIIYLISIPLGIRKAVKNGTAFDFWSSIIITICYAVPAFLFALLLIQLFSFGGMFEIFPLRGLFSQNVESFSLLETILDYFWHIALPTLAMIMGGFASLTLLTKNSFMDELSKQYVMTAKAKGLPQRGVLYRHVFRNAMLIVISSFPASLIGLIFTSSLLIEIIFSLNGLGLLGYTAIIERDYPVIFGTLYLYTLIGLLVKLLTDLSYILIDPRINFEGGR